MLETYDRFDSAAFSRAHEGARFLDRRAIVSPFWGMDAITRAQVFLYQCSKSQPRLNNSSRSLNVWSGMIDMF